MKNTIGLSASPLLLILLATGCSSDSHHSQQPSSPAIQFSVVAPPTPRFISQPEITTATIDNFLLNAFTDKKTFISDLRVTRENNSWTYAPAYYWPATPVNFYAVSPTESKMSRPEGADADSFRAGYTNTGSIDLLYSVAKDQTPTSSTTPKAVQLNFRHALSRLAISMKSSNSDIRVKVYSVELENVMTQGIFTFPDETTSVSGAPSLDGNGNTSAMGKWSDWSVPANTSIYDNPAGSDYLTASATEFSNTGYNFALPQPLSEASSAGRAVTGSYIKVKCVIDNGAGIRLWPNSQTPAENKEGDYGIIRFSLRNAAAPQSWQPGIGYIYNLDINKVPGLDLIDFTVTVDEINLYTGAEMED